MVLGITANNSSEFGNLKHYFICLRTSLSSNYPTITEHSVRSDHVMSCLSVSQRISKHFTLLYNESQSHVPHL